MDELLPEADWIKRSDLAALVDALGVENVRWVGGAVRDTLLGSDVQDVDAATPLVPDEVIARLDAAEIRNVPTGIDHGTVTAVLPGGPVEITTLRRDVSTDGRRATIAFAGDWRDDAARRDFTFNALYAHPETREILDFFGGLQDLTDRRVRFIGEARERIREDHLRILRYYRFHARFGAELDAQAEEACAELAETLKGLSRERVAKELLQLLGLPDPYPTVERMFEQGVISVILPETGKPELGVLKQVISAEEECQIAPESLRRLAALIPASPETAQTVATRLRLSRSQRERLISLAKRDEADLTNQRGLAYRQSMTRAVDRILLQGGKVSPLRNWEPPQFPLKGGEIVQRGVDAGPEVARILQAVEARWIEEGFPERARVVQFLDQELG